MKDTGRPLEERTRLHLGAGLHYDPEAVNIDIAPAVNPDIVHDLNRLPWPLPSDRFESVVLRDVLEHLDNPVAILEEIHRVCRGGARVEITVPHFSSHNTFVDPTHRRAFSALTFDHFTEGHRLGYYTSCRYRILRRQIVFHPSWVNKIVWRLANRFPEWYERRWAWTFPAWFVAVDLEVVK